MALSVGWLLRRVIAAPPEGLRLSPHQWKTVRALAACRTGALGGQVYCCHACHREHFVAHSCRNRHCPQCQGKLADEWLEEQEAALLPIPYFHLVFTVPHVLNGLVRQNRTALYKLIFEAASTTLLEFGEGRFRARLGMTAVLHTWSQTLLDHYHLHCIVSGGGVALDGSTWIGAPDYYLFPVRALSASFRGKFLHGLAREFKKGKLEFHGQERGLARPRSFRRLLRVCSWSKWVVYAKRPFAGPRQVLAYLSRYTHRVAISNRRLISGNEASVTFGYKDYAHGSELKQMTLNTFEFVRRFCLHILPSRFVKIRHYGLLGNRNREQHLKAARKLLGTNPAVERGERRKREPSLIRRTDRRCPFCGSPSVAFIREVPMVRSPNVLDSS